MYRWIQIEKTFILIQNWTELHLQSRKSSNESCLLPVLFLRQAALEEEVFLGRLILEQEESLVSSSGTDMMANL